MKRVLLLGDSIRLSYEAGVRERLHGDAHVLGPADNGQHSTNLLLQLNAWAIKPYYDVIHLNAGLWDVRQVVYGGAENVVPVDLYRANVRALLTVLRRETSARLMWATTTPVVGERCWRTHRRMGSPTRNPDDIARYNDAAVAEAQALDVPVNDLCAAVADAGADRLLGDDGIHFTPEGAEFLADRVAAAVRTLLD